MDRYTQKNGNSYYVADEKIIQSENGCTGDAIEMLAKFENYYNDLFFKQEQVIKEMEKLKSENKTHTVKFRQLLANKLNNSSNLLILNQFGIQYK